MSNDNPLTLDEIAAAEAAAGASFTAGRLEPAIDIGFDRARSTLRVATELLASSPAALRERLFIALEVVRPLLGSPERFLPFEAAAYALELQSLLLPDDDTNFATRVRALSDEDASAAARLLVQLSASAEQATPSK